jgi:hypothetical protein
MAKMIPTYINPDVQSGAERKLFELIRDSKDLNDYTCLHSLGIARHVHKRQGEIDFVLVGNGIILCLEVKGGRVVRKDGAWFFKDRYGQENKKIEGPFVQASTGMYSLKKDLEAKFGTDHGYLFGYGVLFPDIQFDEDSPEWDKDIIYDIDNALNPISKYVEKLSYYWKQKSPSFVKKQAIAKSEIINYLRGDFEMATRLWSDIAKTEGEIIFFTKEQYRALDQMEGNSKVIFTGAAGTGKTLLAVEKARRLYYSKQKTLILCFNKFLGARLHKEIVSIDPSGVYLQANSIHKYFSQVIDTAGLRDSLNRQAAGKTSQELYNELLPSLFATAAEKILKEKFDCLIIDEGQDLLTESYLLALDYVLKGGLKDGHWTVFLDQGGQAKLFNRFSLESYNYLKSLGASEYKLDLNVRNTLQIATQASIVSGFPAGKTRIEGPKVEYKLCSNEEEMALQVAELINKLILEESVPPSSISLLSRRNMGSMSIFATGIKVPRYLIEADEMNIINPPSGRVLCASAQAFKGLENNVIIYTDVDSFSGDFSESINYVAMTRAKEKLYVFLDKKLKTQYQERIKSFTNIE